VRMAQSHNLYSGRVLEILHASRLQTPFAQMCQSPHYQAQEKIMADDW